MKTLSSFLLLSLFAFAAHTDEADVRAAVDKFNHAAHAGDEATLNGLLSGDLVYGHSSAKIETKAECVAALVKGKPDFVMDPTFDVKVYGKTAVVHGLMTANLVQNAQPVKTRLDILQVWVKDGSAWKMVARHTTRLPS